MSELRDVEHVHVVKSWPGSFGEVAQGVKRWELRRDDRDYRVGDLLILREWDPDDDTFSGSVLISRITDLHDRDSLGDFCPGFPGDFAILSIELLPLVAPGGEA